MRFSSSVLFLCGGVLLSPQHAQAAWPDSQFGGTSTRGFDNGRRSTPQRSLEMNPGTQSPESQAKSANDRSPYFPDGGVGGDTIENGTQPIMQQHHPHDSVILLDERCLTCLKTVCSTNKFILPPTNRYCCKESFVLAFNTKEVNCRRFEHLGTAAYETCLLHKSDWNICVNLVLEDVCVGCQEDATDGVTGAEPWLPSWSGDGDTLNTSATVGLAPAEDPYPTAKRWADGTPYTVGDVALFKIKDFTFLYDATANHVANLSNAPNSTSSLWNLNDRVDGWWPSQNLDFLLGDGSSHGKISRPPPDQRNPPFQGNATAKRYILRMLELLEFSPYFNSSHFVAECFAPTTSPLYHERQGGVEQCFVSLAQQTYIKTYNLSHVTAQSDISQANGVTYSILGAGSDKMPSGNAIDGQPTNIPMNDVDTSLSGIPVAFNRTDPGYMWKEFVSVLQLFP